MKRIFFYFDFIYFDLYFIDHVREIVFSAFIPILNESSQLPAKQ